ncbi:MAG: hypothetical protein KBS62_03110 [Oscillospiraceae bacterium]|nr:hypothetical protein [Candidatus Ruminococcus equi]
MIDIENKIVNDVSNALINAFSQTYPTLTRYSEYVELPQAFPCVCLYEETNTVHTQSSTLTKIENHADVSYVCYVYANDGDKKQVCKDIASVVSDKMEDLGFVRTFREAIPNADRSIFRIMMRFTAIVEKGIQVGNNTIYKIY